MAENITFAHPQFLWLLLLIPLLLTYHYLYRRKQEAVFKISNLKALKNYPRTTKVWIKKLLPLVRMSCLAFIIIALARPQSTFSNEKITTEGIDIIASIDVSSSMLATDFRPNRIEAAKDVLLEFIRSRPNDRIGLVVFSGESFTMCPLTSDHPVLSNLVSEINSGILQDGTAIGMGLATSADRLRESEAKSKVIILLTDGVNNSGFIDPLTAAEIAQKYNIRVYTVGVGKQGKALYPSDDGMDQYMDVQIDEELLKKIAEMTGGKYFRATNNNKLKNIYTEIDRLEKTRIEVSSFHRKSEEFYELAMWAGMILLLEVLLGYTLLRSWT